MGFRQKAEHVPLAREGIPYIFMAVFVTVIAALSACWIFTWILVVLTLLVTHFFRDPQRVTAAAEGEVVSPADGKVIVVEQALEPCFTHHNGWKISIFMSVFDVHVNRIPYSGVVKGLHYRKGRFRAAQKARASLENEQNWLWLETDSGRNLVFTQVAGLIARRIVCWPEIGDEVVRGERFGMIRFGSRLDVYVPQESEIVVSKGDRVCAGESVLCRMK